MPELPEVETVRLGLANLIVGKILLSIDVMSEKSLRSSRGDIDAFAIGAEITGLDRRGKLLIIHLSTDYSLLVHLRMTGQMVYDKDLERFGAGHPNDSLVNSLPDNTTRIVATFSDGSKLFFNDLRKFGYWMITPTDKIEQDSFISKLGPEPLDSGFTKNVFNKQLDRRKGTSIKAALLDQTVLAGVGNIYADEALFSSKIHPSTRVSRVKKNERDTLHQSIVDVMNVSIAHGGSSDKNYVNAEGKRGSYLAFANVFRREGQPCPVCGDTIIKIRVAGRGTHVCPNCQNHPVHTMKRATK